MDWVWKNTKLFDTLMVFQKDFWGKMEIADDNQMMR